MSNWQSIDTLPTGEHVLLWFPKGERGNGGVETAMVFIDGNEWSFWTHGGPNSGSDWYPANDELPTQWAPIDYPKA